MYSDFSSKNREKALRIFQKLEGDHFHKQQPTQKLLDEKYLQLADKMRAFHSKNQRSMNWLEQELQKQDLQSKIIGKNIDKNQAIEKQLFEALEKDMSMQYSEYVEYLKQMRKGMIQQIEHKYRTMKNEAIEYISEDFEQCCRRNHNQIAKHLQKVMDLLEQEKNKKQENAEYLSIIFGDEIINLQQTIAKEKQERRNKNKGLMERITEIEDRFQRQIDEEIKEREMEQEKREKKLEEICYQIQVRAFGKN